MLKKILHSDNKSTRCLHEILKEVLTGAIIWLPLLINALTLDPLLQQIITSVSMSILIPLVIAIATDDSKDSSEHKKKKRRKKKKKKRKSKG